MKTIVLLGAAIIAGAARYPVEGPIPVRDDAEADRLIELGLAEAAEEEDETNDSGSADEGDGLEDEKVADLKSLAELEEIDLGKATSKPDIIAAIRAAREAKEG